MNRRLLTLYLLVGIGAMHWGCTETPQPWYEQARTYAAFEEPPGMTDLEDGRVRIKIDFADSDQASLETVKDAYEILLNTHEFAPGYVGMTSMPSRQGLAFNLILVQPDALEAFKALIRRGYPAGQLYGLCGLYFIAPDAFRQRVELFRTSSDSVNVLRGDTGGLEAVRELVYDSSAVRLNPGESIAQYWQESQEESARADIYGGWYCQQLVEESDPIKWQARLDSLLELYQPE